MQAVPLSPAERGTAWTFAAPFFTQSSCGRYRLAQFGFGMPGGEELLEEMPERKEIQYLARETATEPPERGGSVLG